MKNPQPVMSFGRYMDSTTGFTTGFDYLRLILATGVLLWHSYPVAYGNPAGSALVDSFAGYWIAALVPMFFALSGFLVCASLMRVRDVRIFLGLRALRIVPALAVQVILAALLLGPIVTVLDASDYFSDIGFWKFFTNIIAWSNLLLPGVFIDNPYPAIVNASLWTVPYEFLSYVLLTAILFRNFHTRPALLAAMFVGLLLMRLAWQLHHGAKAGSGANVKVLAYFMAGALLYLNRHSVPKNGWLAVVCLLVGLSLTRNRYFSMLAAVPVAYATVWIGLLQIRKLPVLIDNDYSYGIYLYAWPIQQAFAQYLETGRTYAGNVVLSLLATTVVAVISWHNVEKPLLGLKSRLYSGLRR